MADEDEYGVFDTIKLRSRGLEAVEASRKSLSGDDEANFTIDDVTDELDIE